MVNTSFNVGGMNTFGGGIIIGGVFFSLFIITFFNSSSVVAGWLLVGCWLVSLLVGCWLIDWYFFQFTNEIIENLLDVLMVIVCVDFSLFIEVLYSCGETLAQEHI